MTDVTLVTGPAGSGKTEALIQRAAERYRADAFAASLVLVPTSRHADQFRRRLVAQCAVAFNLRVHTIPQLAHDLAAAGALEVPSLPVAAALLAQVTVREVERGPAAYFRPIAASRGLARLVGEAVRELLAQDVSTAEFSAGAANAGEALAALGALYHSYRAALDAHGWVHPAGLPAALARGAALPRLDMLLVDGFQFLGRGELAFVGALARAAGGACSVTFDPDCGPAGSPGARTWDGLRALFPGATVVAPDRAAPPPARAANAAHDSAAQLRGIAREIKATLSADPALRPSDFAVTFRQVGPYVGLARQVFAEFDLPLDPAAGEPLAGRPLGAWLLRLLRLPGAAGDGWRLRDLLAVLRSQFIDRARWGLDDFALGLVARRGRERRLWAGVDALRTIGTGENPPGRDSDAPARPPSAVEAAAGAALAAALDELRPLLAPPGLAPAGDYARALEVALFGAHPLVRPVARALAGVEEEVEAVRGRLLTFAAIDEALPAPPVAFATFVDSFAEALEASATILREPGGVLLAPMHTLHGLRFRHLIAAGLVEGEFPAPVHTAGLLDDGARERLARAGIDLPPPARASEDQLWDTVTTRSDMLSLWRTTLDQRGRPRAPSYYFGGAVPGEPRPRSAAESASRRELALACVSGWREGRAERPRRLPAWALVRAAVAVEQGRRSFEPAGAFEGLVPAGPSLLPGAVDRWSATRLESYRTCGFQYFGSYALRLHELDEELDAADPAIRGSVVHEIMQAALTPLVAAGRALRNDTLAEALEELQRTGPPLWDAAPARYSFGRAGLWRAEWPRVRDQLASLLRREAEVSEALGVDRIASVERSLAVDLPLQPPMAFAGRIDRADSGDGLAVVVDYKSGARANPKDVRDGRLLQLQLYSLAAHAGLPQGTRVVARYAYLDPRHKPLGLDTALARDGDTINAALEVAASVRAAVEAGRFPVTPGDRPCPGYCPLRASCRVNHFSRAKSWS